MFTPCLFWDWFLDSSQDSRKVSQGIFQKKRKKTKLDTCWGAHQTPTYGRLICLRGCGIHIYQFSYLSIRGRNIYAFWFLTTIGTGCFRRPGTMPSTETISDIEPVTLSRYLAYLVVVTSYGKCIGKCTRRATFWLWNYRGDTLLGWYFVQLLLTTFLRGYLDSRVSRPIDGNKKIFPRGPVSQILSLEPELFTVDSSR